MSAWNVAMNDPNTVIDETKNPKGVVMQIGHRDEYDIEIRSMSTDANAVIAKGLSEAQVEEFFASYHLREEPIEWARSRYRDAGETITQSGAAQEQT